MNPAHLPESNRFGANPANLIQLRGRNQVCHRAKHTCNIESTFPLLVYGQSIFTHHFKLSFDLRCLYDCKYACKICNYFFSNFQVSHVTKIL